MDPAQEVHYTDGEHEALVTRVGDLRDLELAGTVTAETLIWAEGSAISDWTPFAQCRETLFGKSRVSAFAAHLDAAGEDEVAPANAENASVLAGLSKLKEGGALLSKPSGANDDEDLGKLKKEGLSLLSEVTKFAGLAFLFLPMGSPTPCTGIDVGAGFVGRRGHREAEAEP